MLMAARGSCSSLCYSGSELASVSTLLHGTRTPTPVQLFEWTLMSFGSLFWQNQNQEVLLLGAERPDYSPQHDSATTVSDCSHDATEPAGSIGSRVLRRVSVLLGQQRFWSVTLTSDFYWMSQHGNVLVQDLLDGSGPVWFWSSFWWFLVFCKFFIWKWIFKTFLQIQIYFFKC